MSGGSREFCEEDEAGERSDADLHDFMLDNPAAGTVGIRLSRERWIATGGDPEAAKELFPIPGEDD